MKKSGDAKLQEYMDPNHQAQTNSIRNEIKKRPRWMIKTERLLECYPVVIFVSIVTVYTLFFDDIRVLLIEK